MNESDTIKSDCPCTAVDCECRGRCEGCRERHAAKGGKPFCEQDEAERAAQETLGGG